MAPYLGHCLCGNVRHRVDLEPLMVYACHCTECQRRTGSAFAISMIDREPAEARDYVRLWQQRPGERNG